MDYKVHGILQAWILEWVAGPFSRRSSQCRDRTQVSGIAGGFVTSWATREAQEYWGANRGLLHCRQILYQLSHPGNSTSPIRLTHFSTNRPWDFLTICLGNIPWVGNPSSSALLNPYPPTVILSSFSYPKLMSHLWTAGAFTLYTILWQIVIFF